MPCIVASVAAERHIHTNACSIVVNEDSTVATIIDDDGFVCGSHHFQRWSICRGVHALFGWAFPQNFRFIGFSLSSAKNTIRLTRSVFKTVSLRECDRLGLTSNLRGRS
jgi:hypothetical protein